MTPPTLTLYTRPACGYCRRVVQAAESLGVPLRMVNIWNEPEAGEHLIRELGRATVPVLGIQTPQGEELLPESRQIVAYLRQLG